jgi:hypothetical protein
MPLYLLANSSGVVFHLLLSVRSLTQMAESANDFILSGESPGVTWKIRNEPYGSQRLASRSLPPEQKPTLSEPTGKADFTG